MVWNKNKQAQKKRKQPSQVRKNYSKRQRYNSIFNAINATAPQATLLSIPTPLTTSTISPENRDSIASRARITPMEDSIIPPVIQEDDGSPIVVNGVEIPSLCADIDRKNTLEKALEFLTRTEVEEDPPVSPDSPESSNPSTEKHRACVCVICDSFILSLIHI